MEEYSKSKDCKLSLKGTFMLLKHTSVLVSIFQDKNYVITSGGDERLTNMLEVNVFFDEWESNNSGKSLEHTVLTKECRQDLSSSILGFFFSCTMRYKSRAECKTRLYKFGCD